MPKKELSAPTAIDDELIGLTIETWFREHFHHGAIARDTVAYNQSFTAKNDLLRRLKKLLPPAPVVESKSGGQVIMDEIASMSAQKPVADE